MVNRLLIPFLNDAVAVHAAGRTPAEVDAVLVEVAQHPMGPLALIDLIGVDVTVAALASMAQTAKLPPPSWVIVAMWTKVAARSIFTTLEPTPSKA